MIFGRKDKDPDGRLTGEQVMDALASVIEPDKHQDVVALGLIKSVAVEEGVVRVTFEPLPPGYGHRDQLGRDVRAAVSKLRGFKGLSVDFGGGHAAGRPAPQGQSMPGVRNIIAVGSGKGGVGKSTTALNLAVMLARTGARIGLLDADIYGPNLPSMMGLTGRPQVHDKKMIPLERFGVRMISMGLLVDEDQPVVWRGPMLHNVIQQFLGDVAWGDLDCLVVDLPPGTGDVQLSLVQQARVTGAVIVTTPQGVSLMDARKAMAMFHMTNTPVLGIIENMSYFICPNCNEMHDIFSSGGGERTAAELGIPFLGAIPLGINVREGGDKGVPVAVAEPDCEQSVQYAAIARALAERIAESNREDSGAGGVEIKLGGH
jgi:ATP-binding protein involved in chromosome partitioning